MGRAEGLESNSTINKSSDPSNTQTHDRLIVREHPSHPVQHQGCDLHQNTNHRIHPQHCQSKRMTLSPRNSCAFQLRDKTLVPASADCQSPEFHSPTQLLASIWICWSHYHKPLLMLQYASSNAQLHTNKLVGGMWQTAAGSKGCAVIYLI